MNNIKKYRLLNGMKQIELCSILGISQGALSGWENGHYEPDIKSLNKMAQQFNITIDELLGNDDKSKNFPDYPANIFSLKTKKVPLLGTIACGEPIFANEEHGEFVLTSDDISADFCLRAKGDSMIGARIFEGDIVFVKEQETVDNGQIAAVLIEDEATLKRVYYYPDKNKLILSPENPAYEPLVYIGEELNEVRILGRAVAFQSVLR